MNSKDHDRTYLGRFSKQSVVARFMEKVSPPDANGCRLYTGSKNRWGYGAFRLDGKVRRAHVVSAMAYYGPVPPGMFVCHRCDVRACVNPQHLFFGTRKQNMEDCVAKGRSVRMGRHSLKLTDDDVRAIRYLEVPSSMIADVYGITISMVSKIKTNASWAWVK